MPFPNLLGFNQKEVGPETSIKKWSQLPTISNPQQAAQYAMLAKGLYGMFQPQPNFEPIKQQYMRDYRNNVMPGILNNATASGFGQGSGLQQAVAGADTDLAYRLAALQQNFNQHQYDQNREQSNQLLQQGMKPSFENLYAPVPYEQAEQYLKSRGNPNPSAQEIEAALPQFSPPAGLGQDIQSFGNKGFQKAQDYYNEYKRRGLKGVSDLARGEVPLSQATQGGGPANTVSESLQQTPQVAKAFSESLQNAATDQKQAADWIVANKKAAMPILSQKLEPQDYPMLKGMLEDTKPYMNKLAYALGTKKELDELRKVIEKAREMGNEKVLKQYILRHFGIREE